MQLAITINGQSADNPSLPHISGADPSYFIQVILTAILVFSIIICLFTLVWGGVNWIISEGKKENVDKARNQILFSVIGLAVVLLSYFIINVIGGFFGVNLTH